MSDITDNDIKFLFQEEVLDQHGKFLLDLFEETLEKKKIYDTGELMTSLDYKVITSGANKVLEINFEPYGRMLEIRMTNSKRKNRMDVNTNHLLWGATDNSMRKPKNVKWYSKNAYGSLNRLIRILMYEFSDIEIARLKGILENRLQGN